MGVYDSDEKGVDAAADAVADAAADAAAEVEEVAAETVAAVKKSAKKTAKAVKGGEVDATDVKAAAEQLSEDVEDVMDDAADYADGVVAEGKKTAKQATAKTKQTAKGALEAISADLDALDAQVKEAAGRARDTIDDAVDSGTATSADIRKALEDLVSAIEHQRIFVDARKALDGALSSFEKSHTVSYMRSTAEDTMQDVRRRPFRDMLQKVLFAGIGAAALTRDEVEAFVNRMVQRGDIAESEAEAVVEDVMATSKKQAARLDAEVDKRVKAALKQSDVPTTADVEDLNAKIAALQRKVEELSKKVS
jgi:poly(hydroxyalkanoate) granule-associated protein